MVRVATAEPERPITLEGMAEAMTTYALAADLGGTQIRVALVDRGGSITQRHAIPTLAQSPRGEVVERFVAALKQVAATVEVDSLAGVGVSLASPTDPETGVMFNPPNLPGWDGFSVKPVIEAELSARASCANDATLGALAEQKYGAGKGYRHLIYMTVSTGIGGGIVVDGRLYTGRGGFAGEIGHLTVERSGPQCNCGSYGCLEALASGTAVARIARERLDAGEASSLAGAPEVDARAVAHAAEAGDAMALAIMNEAGASLGVGIVTLLNILDPEVIVIGGGMSQSLHLLLPGIEKEIEARAMAHNRGRMPVVKSELGDDVSLLGAAGLAFDAYDREA
ncbi:MAG: ROK family protein [Chloroflexi bacterium]|nr:ROK family protein [Chloroflexota bacterium]